MSNVREKHITFTTTDKDGVVNEWTYWKPKQGGANGAGPYGGFYQSGDKKCLIKQDARVPLNIAEFLAGRIYQAIVPDVSAEIKLVRANENEKISVDGQNVYILSEFIPHWQDLYSAIQLSLHRNPKHSTVKFIETLEIASQLLFRPSELSKFFEQATNGNRLRNFGQVSATSLLVNNTDMNLGNVGITDTEDGQPPKLAIIDYGASFRDMTPKINPHSFKKYIPTHTFHHEGWNNFKFYPESIKLTEEFVAELDKAAHFDLEEVIRHAFADIRAFYGIRPIIEFAIRAGVLQRYSEGFFTRLMENKALADKQMQQIEGAILSALKQRQADLSRFSAQIKMDMCVRVGAMSSGLHLHGSCHEVIFSHFDYFKEIMLGQERFKFRKSLHKSQPHLAEELNHNLLIIAACFIFVDQNTAIRDKYNIHTMDDALNALKKRLLGNDTLAVVLNTKYIPSVKIQLLQYEHDEFERVLKIISSLNIPLEEAGIEYKRLQKNRALQVAIIELDKKCTEFAVNYNRQKKDALNEYKKNTIALSLQGAEKFKASYPAVEAQAVKVIDDNNFLKFARLVANGFLLALATVTGFGMLAMAYTSKQRGGFLLFQGPNRDLSRMVSKFDVIEEPAPIASLAG